MFSVRGWIKWGTRWAIYYGTGSPPSKPRKPKKRGLPVALGVVTAIALVIVGGLIISSLSNRAPLSDANLQNTRIAANVVTTQIAQTATAGAAIGPSTPAITPIPTNTQQPTAVIAGNAGAGTEMTFALEGYPGYLKTNLCVSVGQTLTIESSGTVRVGNFVGVVGPEGTDVGFMGFALGPEFDIVGKYPHGTVMCRIEGELEWQMCGASLQFVAATAGCLELQVNDNDTPNNTGQFTVKASVR